MASALASDFATASAIAIAIGAVAVSTGWLNAPLLEGATWIVLSSWCWWCCRSPPECHFPPWNRKYSYELGFSPKGEWLLSKRKRAFKGVVVMQLRDFHE
jgi:hypothetical protein